MFVWKVDFIESHIIGSEKRDAAPRAATPPRLTE
ncbi:Uncharacterised protein [Collinsella aerofaciens]|nr:Uncharacterised protein [Collinsella aerofaciens]